MDNSDLLILRKKNSPAIETSDYRNRIINYLFPHFFRITILASMMRYFENLSFWIMILIDYLIPFTVAIFQIASEKTISSFEIEYRNYRNAVITEIYALHQITFFRNDKLINKLTICFIRWR